MYLTNSSDLSGWERLNIEKLSLLEYETNLKVFFAKIYTALTNLKEKGYIYTDLKPQNILIGPNNDPYLIDLESVVETTGQHICLYTENYFPKGIKGESNFYKNPC